MTPLERLQAKLVSIFQQWSQCPPSEYMEATLTDWPYISTTYPGLRVIHVGQNPGHGLSCLEPWMTEQPPLPLDLFDRPQPHVILCPLHPHGSNTELVWLSKEQCRVLQSCAYMASLSARWGIPVFVLDGPISPSWRPSKDPGADYRAFYGVANMNRSSISPDALWHMARLDDIQRRTWSIPKRSQQPRFDGLLCSLLSYLNQAVSSNVDSSSFNPVPTLISYSISITPWSDHSSLTASHDRALRSLLLFPHLQDTDPLVPFSTALQGCPIDRMHVDVIFDHPSGLSPPFAGCR